MLLPLLALLTVVYLCYLLAYQALVAQSRNLAAELRPKLPPKHWTVTLAEVNYSWILAAVSTTLLVLVIAWIGLRHREVRDITGPELAPYFWVGFVTMLSSFAVLAVGKLWEREEGQPFGRRIALAAIGACVGLASYAFGEFLMIPLNGTSVFRNILNEGYYADDGTPQSIAFAIHFALLFAALRWWQLTDPLRAMRINVLAIVLAALVHWLLNLLFPLPQPAGVLVVGLSVFVVQGSAIKLRQTPPADPADPGLREAKVGLSDPAWKVAIRVAFALALMPLMLVILALVLAQ